MTVWRVCDALHLGFCAIISCVLQFGTRRVAPALCTAGIRILIHIYRYICIHSYQCMHVLCDGLHACCAALCLLRSHCSPRWAEGSCQQSPRQATALAPDQSPAIGRKNAYQHRAQYPHPPTYPLTIILTQTSALLNYGSKIFTQTKTHTRSSRM